MSESTDLIPLRCSADDLKYLFFGTRNPHEDLMAFKDKSFERPEDFIQEVKRVIHFIKNDARPLDYQDFYSRTNTSFAFVYQKIDGLYRQKSIELQSKDLDEKKEKEIKSLLRDLLKCELEIEKISEAVDDVYDGYNPILYEQLETLFDDYELLDLLLLVISKKLKSDEMTEPLKTKGLYFISPFLKLFYGEKGDILDFLGNPQDFLSKSNVVEDAQKDIEKILSQYTDLNKSEISRFCEEIKCSSELRQIVTKEKHRFQEGKRYCEVLGNLSLLLCLRKQEVAGSDIFFPLARIGLVGYSYYLDGWKNLKNGIERAQLDRYLKLSNLNLKDKVDLPIQFLKYLSKRELNEVDLQLMELGFSAFNSLIKSSRSVSSDGPLSKRFEECIDDCLLILMHELYEFLDSKILTMNEMHSSYLIGSSLSENLISEWLWFFEEIPKLDFVGTYDGGAFQYKEKYFSSFKILLHDLLEFIAFEEHAFLTLPEYLQANLIHACSSVSLDDRVFIKSDLEKIFLYAQDIGVANLRGPRDGKALLRFKTLIKVVKVPGAQNGLPFGDRSQSEEFIKKIYESKLVEEFIVVYEENKSFLQTVGDLNVTEAVWELFDFLAKFSLKDASFLAKERNLNFLKNILQDSCEIDPRAADRQCYRTFLSGVESLLTKITFAGHLKEEKLFFGILRLFVFRPFLNSDNDDRFPQNFYNALIQKETFLHLFGKFLEIFENKMRDPSLDVFDTLKQFEKGNYQETSIPYLTEKDAPIINERVNFDSLRSFAGGFCKRVAFFVGKIPSEFDWDEQVGVLAKRFGRMIVDPLLVFACNQFFLRTLRNAFDDMHYSKNKEALIYAFEGVFAGVIDICEEFKFNEYSIIAKLDAKRLSKMVTKIATIHYLRKEDIPTDITYQEAALMSFLIGLVNFNRCVASYDKTPCKKLEELAAQFNPLRTEYINIEILKISIFGLEQRDDYLEIKRDKSLNIDKGDKIIKNLTEKFRQNSVKNTKKFFRKFYFGAQVVKEATELIDQVKNNILKCFSLETVKESRNVQALAKDCKIIFEGSNFYLNLWISMFDAFNSTEALQPSTKEVYKTILGRFELELVPPHGQDEKSVLAGIVYNTLRLKEMSKSLYRVDQDLFAAMITSPDGLNIMLQLELYLLECANRYCDSKTKDLVVTLADILEACFSRINPSRQKYCFEKDGKALFQVIIDFLEKLAEIQIQRNCKTLLKKNLAAVFVFIRAISESYSTYTKEKATLVEDSKQEIQRFIDAVVQCQHLNLGDLKKVLVFDIPLDYWVKLSEQVSGDLSVYVRNLLQGSSDDEIKLKGVSKYKSVDQIYQLDFKYQRLEQFFMKEILDKFSLDKDLIEGLLMATKQTLQNLVSEDLNLFAREKECLDFPETLAGFISRINKLAINFIVSGALKKETDSILSVCLDLAESILDAQKSILSGLRRDIFSGSKSCYQSLIYLINTILRANKVLRVEFINKGILGRILTMERLRGFSSNEITSVLLLMATLLEDSLMLDSQVDLALKNAMKKNSKISLEDLMKDKNFISLQNYKQVLEKLKLYGIKSNGSLELSDLGKDQNFTERLSPVAEECIQTLLKSLIENYAFEKESIASLVKVKEQQESGQRKQLSKRGIFPRGYLLVDQKVEQEDETFDEPNVYLNEGGKREMIVKDSSALVVILSGILSSYPHLIPIVIFQELSVGDILKSDHSDLMSFFKSNSRYSIYDILLRLVLLKDGNSAVFLIASLIEDNKITLESVDLKYILLTKTFVILEDLLTCEETQGKAVETLNSVLMRRNIAMIIGFINDKVHQDNGFQYKEEILQLVMQTTQKLLHNPQMIAYSLQMSAPKYSMIRIISDTVKQNTSKIMSREEVAENYANILKVLKTRESHEPKFFSTNFKDVFEKNLFIKNESKNKISYEDQKQFEMWEERSQWEKEETKRLLEIAGLKEKELLSEVKLAIGENSNLSSVFDENDEEEVIGNLKSLYESKQGENNSKLGYLLGKLKESNVLGQYQEENAQSLGHNIDKEILLPLLKVDFSKIEEIKNDTSLNIIQLYIQEQTKDLTEEVEKQNSPPPSSLQENREEEEKEVQVEETDDKQEEKEEEGSSFKYFMNPAVKNEDNFKFRANKALQQSKRLKEMICLEQTLESSNERNEETTKEFTSKMTEFDKNVVYASLGKRFEAGLSEELLKIIHEARKELLAIQQDFDEYEEANNSAAKVEDDIDGEDEEYGDLDYNFQFLVVEDDEEEENDQDEDQEELIEEQDEEILEAVKPENNEKISKLLKSFEVDDNFIMSVLELYFCYFNPSSNNETKVGEFLRDSLSLNPANEIKIIDTMITLLYTPEFFEYHFKKQCDNYQTAVEKILNYLTEYYQETTLNYILFVPKTYLESFGNKLLKNVKESTNFAYKVSDCHTVLDMLLNLIETPSFSRKDQWILKIVEGFSLLISQGKDINFGETVSQTDSYKNLIPCKRILSLLSLLEKPTTTSSLKVQEIYLNFRSVPKLFVPLHDSLSNHFYQTIVKMNSVLEQNILVLKKEPGKTEILEDLNAGQFELILTILISFANVFHENLGKKSKVSKKIENFLRTLTGSLFNEEEVKAFFVNIHEFAELLNKMQAQDDFKILLNLLIVICMVHYSIIIMGANLEEKKLKSSNNLRKQTGGSSVSDIEQIPSLARLISHEDAGEHNEMNASLQRSYSHFRGEVNVDFGAIFANFALKQSSQISKIVTSKVVAGITLVLSNLVSIIIPKFPWILDFKSKRKLFKMKFEEYLKKNDITPSDTRDIEVDRNNIVFSTMKLFKDCLKNDLIQYNEIEYLNEQGIDGGGLIRDFYETISKQLFDPCVGLFKLAENQISIQPNPVSGMIPYDSTLMQFAGIIVAKALSEEKVMNVNFTKPFLKHILGKTITIGDMEEVDADLGKNLRWILENDVKELYLTFTHEIEVLGERKIIELQKGGSDIFVDEENKKEYVKQICEYRMTKQIKRQLKDFLKGFRMVLPKDLTSYLSTSDLEIMMAGESKVDLEEMKKTVTYINYSPSDQIIQWFWEVLEEFSADQLTAFYYFLSGSTKVPFGGFKENPIRIQLHSKQDILPISHTCDYSIELPNYDSKDKLQEKLLIAIFDGVGEFQMR